jgi:ribokinase
VAPRHPAVGETVLGTDLRLAPGGKGANQAVAAACLGVEALLVGNVGSDAFGQTLVEFLTAHDVKLDGLAVVPQPTGTALIVVGPASQNTIVVVPGANATLDRGAVERIRLEPEDVVVAQYEIPLDVVGAALEQARSVGARSILNPAPAVVTDPDLIELADVVVVNETELALLTGAAPPAGPASPEWALRAALGLRRHPDQMVVATLGRDGVVAAAGDAALRVAGRAVTAVDSTGAGDCFVGTLASSLGAGAPLEEALAFANAAASISVQRPGAAPSMPSLAEVRAALASGPP